MAYEVKIITFINDREGREDGEETLTRLVNDGWEIKTAGGGTGAEMVWGFVILQRERRDTAVNLERLDLGTDPNA
ncbi:hypothetical protein VZO05_02730 [Aggregatilineales bacterium SYSU G02658]